MDEWKPLPNEVVDAWYPSPGIVAVLEASASVPSVEMRVMFRKVVQYMLFQEIRATGYRVHPSHPRVLRRARVLVCAAEDEWLARDE
jgi:hypothetical protein